LIRLARAAGKDENSLTEQCIPEPTVEALDESVLHWLSGGDVVPLDPCPIGPTKDRIAGELAAIVADNHLRLATLSDKAIQLTGHSQP